MLFCHSRLVIQKIRQCHSPKECFVCLMQPWDHEINSHSYLLIEYSYISSFALQIPNYIHLSDSLPTLIHGLKNSICDEFGCTVELGKP